ncbi:MAG TPA: hypothetical protein VK137_16750, partial [Planctomycetaceae bacterium]|nr:hypothetical protein [Planctomycetaceae bacterium]
QRLAATNVVTADRQFVRMSLAMDVGSSNHSTTAVVRNGESLLINVTDSASTRTQVGIPILAKVPNAARLFKNVSQSVVKPGESLFLLATPHIVDAENKETISGIPH